MLDVLGSDGREIVSSGDATEDAESRTNFVKRYDEMHRLVNEPDGTVTLYVGVKNWPSPIPIRSTGQSWYFDTDAARREILFRRIGRNELSTIRVCQELVDAEAEYRASHGGEYAGKIFSDERQHDGLYWTDAPGEIQSPIGLAVASAFFPSQTDQSKHPVAPYHGYFFRALHPLRNRSAKQIVADGTPPKGLAFVAFPSEYRSSGVMTFRTGMDGIVYEKDLGKNTSVLAPRIKSSILDASWHRIEEPIDIVDR
jgi:hypothetical protein